MPQSSKLSRLISIARSCRSRVIAYCDRMLRLSLLAASMLMFAFIPVADVHGQRALGSSQQDNAVQPGGGVSSPLSTTVSMTSQAPEDDRSSSGSSSSPQSLLALSSDQIIQILQQNPDLVVELKTQVADRLQQQGTQIDANDISDQMLYNQIATSADVRASTSTFLLAHGYPSPGGLPAEGSNLGEGSVSGDLLSGEQSLAGVNATRLAAGGSNEAGQSA